MSPTNEGGRNSPERRESNEGETAMESQNDTTTTDAQSDNNDDEMTSYEREEMLMQALSDHYGDTFGRWEPTGGGKAQAVRITGASSDVSRAVQYDFDAEQWEVTTTNKRDETHKEICDTADDAAKWAWKNPFFEFQAEPELVEKQRLEGYSIEVEEQTTAGMMYRMADGHGRADSVVKAIYYVGAVEMEAQGHELTYEVETGTNDVEDLDELREMHAVRRVADSVRVVEKLGLIERAEMEIWTDKVKFTVEI